MWIVDFLKSCFEPFPKEEATLSQWGKLKEMRVWDNKRGEMVFSGITADNLRLLMQCSELLSFVKLNENVDKNKLPIQHIHEANELINKAFDEIADSR